MRPSLLLLLPLLPLTSSTLYLLTDSTNTFTNAWYDRMCALSFLSTSTLYACTSLSFPTCSIVGTSPYPVDAANSDGAYSGGWRTSLYVLPDGTKVGRMLERGGKVAFAVPQGAEEELVLVEREGMWRSERPKEFEICGNVTERVVVRYLVEVEEGFFD